MLDASDPFSPSTNRGNREEMMINVKIELNCQTRLALNGTAILLKRSTITYITVKTVMSVNAQEQ